MKYTLICTTIILGIGMSSFFYNAAEAKPNNHWSVGVQGVGRLEEDGYLGGGVSLRYYGFSPVYLNIDWHPLNQDLEFHNSLMAGMSYAIVEYPDISRLYLSLQAGRRYKEHEWQYTPSWQRSQYTYYGAWAVFGAEVIFPNSHIGISTELGPGTVKWNSTSEGYNIEQGQHSHKYGDTSLAFVFNVGIHLYF